MILKKQRYENGKREIYIFETKVFEYYADKLKKAKRCCDIPYKFLKRLYRENNFQIIHQVGVVISAKARIGNNCKVYQNTTIGEKNGRAPVLGNNVTVYANAVIVGNVHIGSNSVIGAGSVVLSDVPENEIWQETLPALSKKLLINSLPTYFPTQTQFPHPLHGEKIS